MLKRALMLLLTTILIIFLSACAKNGDVESTQTTVQNNAQGNIRNDTQGNTQGNINNKGLVAADDIYLYYSDSQGRLVMQRKKDAEITVLTDDTVEYINVVGEDIVFSNTNDRNRPYRMGIDKGDRFKLAQKAAYYIAVANGIVYFVDDSNYICRVNLDGSDFKQLGKDTSRYFCVTGGLIYFHNLREDRVYRMNLDGSGAKKASDEPLSELSYLTVTGEYIYFIDTDSHISRMDLDGKGKETLSRDAADCMNLSDGRIYFRGRDDKFLHIINADGSNPTTLGQAPKNIYVFGTLLVR